MTCPRSPQPPAPAEVGGGRFRPAMSEDDLQNAVIPLLIQHGFLVHHSRPAWTGRGYRTALQGVPGLLDLVIAKGGAVWLVELKRDTENPTAQQQRWVDAGGGLCGVWRPRDLPWIREWVQHPFEAAA